MAAMKRLRASITCPASKKRWPSESNLAVASRSIPFCTTGGGGRFDAGAASLRAGAGGWAGCGLITFTGAGADAGGALGSTLGAGTIATFGSGLASAFGAGFTSAGLGSAFGSSFTATFLTSVFAGFVLTVSDSTDLDCAIGGESLIEPPAAVTRSIESRHPPATIIAPRHSVPAIVSRPLASDRRRTFSLSAIINPLYATHACALVWGPVSERFGWARRGSQGR